VKLAAALGIIALLGASGSAQGDVVSKDGQVTASFPSSVKPDGDELKNAIEAALEP